MALKLFGELPERRLGDGYTPAPAFDSVAVMKTTKSITLAIAAMCALGASALADQTSADKAMIQNRVQKTGPSGKTWNDQPMVVRAVGYPVRFFERTGRTIMHSPQIVSETFRGERPLLSKNGIMAGRDRKQPRQRVAAAPSGSVANTRG